jgi:hypothetical protein
MQVRRAYLLSKYKAKSGNNVYNQGNNYPSLADYLFIPDGQPYNLFLHSGILNQDEI